MKYSLFLYAFCMHSYANTFANYTKVCIEIDGSAEINIKQANIKTHELETTAVTGTFEQEISQKDGVLYLKYKKTGPKLGMLLNLTVPRNVEDISVSANKSKMVVASYSGALKIKIYKMELTVESMLKSLDVQAEGMRAKLMNVVYPATIASKKLALDAVVTKAAAVSVVSNMCDCSFTLPKDAKVKWSKGFLVSCTSDYENSQDADIVVNVDARLGKLKLEKAK